MKPSHRRWLRRVLWGLSGFLGLVLLGLVTTLAPVDPSATPQAEPVTTRSGAESTRFRAGFGRARLTPTGNAPQEDPAEGQFRSIPLAGYGQRQGVPAVGVHDDLWVKAVAFSSGGSTGVMVTADALIIPREVAQATADELARTRGLERDQIYFSATHTHCSLGGWGQRYVGEAFAGPFNPGVRVWFAGQLAAATLAALDDLQPAELGRGSFAAPQFIRNRLVGERGEVDPEFSLLVVRQADGDRAVLGSYSAHATVLGAEVMEFSGDYPGAWQRAVEESGVQLAAFFAGGVGSQGPRAPSGGFAGVEAMGRTLAEQTSHCLAGITLTNRVDFAVSFAVVTLPDLQVRVTDSLRLRPWATRQLFPPLEETTLLQAFRFGTEVWLSTPCDYSGELALQLKAAARAAGREAVVTSFNGDYIGYVIPSKYYHLDGYEPRVMNFYGPRVADVLSETLTRMAVGDDAARGQ